MATNRRNSVTTLVAAIVLLAIGLFLTLGGTLGTTAGSPIAGTSTQALIIGGGIVVAVIGVALGIITALRRSRS